MAADLAARAGGSPLLAEELTRTVLATQDPDPTLATLYGCLMARLERDATARAVAQLAATIGREFDVTLLHAIGTIERSALDWGLERLVQEDVVVEAGPGRYAFRHVLLQDAARSSQRKQALRSHNLQIARRCWRPSPTSPPPNPSGSPATSSTPASCPRRCAAGALPASRRSASTR